MENMRAHERIDRLEEIVSKHTENHAIIEKKIAENTALTQVIADNTSEIVQLVKGVKGMRSLILWFAPVVAVIYALWSWIKIH